MSTATRDFKAEESAGVGVPTAQFGGLSKGPTGIDLRPGISRQLGDYPDRRLHGSPELRLVTSRGN